jgi:RNA polymerase sigma factor (sigma-70 family)
MRLSDKQLLMACVHGDQTAWEVLVKRYQRLIYTIPRRAGLDEDQAAEVFQEVFTTLFQKLDTIDDPDRLHAWLVTTARRKTWRLISKERLLQQGRSGTTEDEADDELTNIPDGAPLPDEVMVRLEEQHEVRGALAMLGDRCRKLLTLLFYDPEPRSYEEIAGLLGTTAGSIGPTRARCLEKMLRLLAK